MYVHVGGDVDGASKTLIGIATVPDQLPKTSFLIAVSLLLVLKLVFSALAI